MTCTGNSGLEGTTGLPPERPLGAGAAEQMSGCGDGSGQRGLSAQQLHSAGCLRR